MTVSGELHEISVAVGELRAEAAASRKGREVLHQKVDGLTSAVSELAAAIRESNRNVGALADDMAELKPEVEKWRSLRNRAMGGLLAAGVLSAGGGAAAWEGLRNILKGN